MFQRRTWILRKGGGDGSSSTLYIWGIPSQTDKKKKKKSQNGDLTLTKTPEFFQNFRGLLSRVIRHFWLNFGQKIDFFRLLQRGYQKNTKFGMGTEGGIL